MTGQFGGDSVGKLAEIEAIHNNPGRNKLYDTELSRTQVDWLIEEAKRRTVSAELLAALHDILDNSTNRSLGAVEANRHNAEIARRAIAKVERAGERP